MPSPCVPARPPVFRTLLIAWIACGLFACDDERRAPAGDGGASGSGVAGYAGTGGYSGTGSAGTGGGGGTSGVGAAGTGTAGTGTAGTGAAGTGTAGTGAAGMSAGSGATTMDCPATFECVTDPLFNLLSACLPMGGMDLPPECTTDADCVAAGLPEGLCLSEEETGLNGCVQICTPMP